MVVASLKFMTPRTTKNARQMGPNKSAIENQEEKSNCTEIL